MLVTKMETNNMQDEADTHTSQRCLTEQVMSGL